VILEGIMHVVGVRASKDDISATTISQQIRSQDMQETSSSKGVTMEEEVETFQK